MSCSRKTGQPGSSAVQVPTPGLRLDSGDSSAAESGVQGGGGGQRGTRERHHCACDETTSGPGGAGSTKMRNPNSKTRKSNGSSKKTWDAGQRSNRKAKRSRGCG